MVQSGETVTVYSEENSVELLLRPRMSKAKQDDGEAGTRQVRVMEDLGEMISWIIRVEGGKTANLLDPMIRAQITARYQKHKEVIEKIRAAEDNLNRIEEEAKQAAKKRKPQS
jgi:hypothetical protein